MLEIGYRDDGITVGSSGRLFVTVFRQPTNLVRVGEIRRVIERHVARHGEKNASLSVLLPGAASMIPADVREKTAALARDFPSVAAAMVLEGEGFTAALLRAALSAIFLVARNPYPHKIFENVDDALVWLRAMLKKAGVDDLPIDLAASVTAARA